MTSTLGNQVLGTSGQQLQGNSLANQLLQMIVTGQIGQTQVPSNLQQNLGLAGSGLGLVGTGANTINTLTNGLGGSAASGLGNLPVTSLSSNVGQLPAASL